MAFQLDEITNCKSCMKRHMLCWPYPKAPDPREVYLYDCPITGDVVRITLNSVWDEMKECDDPDRVDVRYANP